jgi:DNA (cytosine-5)-methyltransferase 3A
MKILSLFDGMSVAQQALKNVGIKIDDYYASEIDPYAIATTQSNFPDTIQLGDIKDLANELEKMNREWTKDIDLIVGGSPCQDLSIAKKGREGLSGARSGLFWEYVRILKEVNPKYFILENVNSMPKEAKELITETLWGIEPIMINAALVSAQNRKRLFWVGKLDEFGTYKKVEIPQPEDMGILLKDILEENVDEKYILF